MFVVKQNNQHNLTKKAKVA